MKKDPRIFALSSVLACVMAWTSIAGHSEARASTVADPEVVVFIGDSLTDGYGVDHSEAYPEIAARWLTEHGHKVRVINGGISGSVSADADR